MSAHDTNPAHFNRTARSLHWLMAVLIIAMLFIGVGMVSSVSTRPWLIDLHRPMGIAILLLAVLRLRATGCATNRRHCPHHCRSGNAAPPTPRIGCCMG